MAEGTPLAHTLLYTHSTGGFSQIPIPDAQSEGICLLGLHDGVVYGVARQKLYRLADDAWSFVMDIQLGNDFREMVFFDNYAVIASGWNSSGAGARGGFEIVDLVNLTSRHYTTADVPLPSDSIFALETQAISETVCRLWFGTFQGLAYCDIDLTALEMTPAEK